MLNVDSKSNDTNTKHCANKYFQNKNHLTLRLTNEIMQYIDVANKEKTCERQNFLSCENVRGS